MHNYITNPLTSHFAKNTPVILLAHGLIGTVRGKSANGLLMHQPLFNIVAIVDFNAVGADTARVCPGVTVSVPVYANVTAALAGEGAKVLILLVPPTPENQHDIETAINAGFDIINTSFDFIANMPELTELATLKNIRFFDLRNVSGLHAYPNTSITERKVKVVFVTGTDCGLGKRTAAYELVCEARTRGIKAEMLATGQTGLMLGERGTVVDALVSEFSNGMVSQMVMAFDTEGCELLFVEGQSDIFHPANSAVSLALLHGCNPDCVVIVHDESRQTHKGFEENAPLYKMHPLTKHIEALEMLSLPCGPVYKTVAIATRGEQNIKAIKSIVKLPVADVRQNGGPDVILNAVLEELEGKALVHSA